MTISYRIEETHVNELKRLVKKLGEIAVANTVVPYRFQSTQKLYTICFQYILCRRWCIIRFVKASQHIEVVLSKYQVGTSTKVFL